MDNNDNTAGQPEGDLPTLSLKSAAPLTPLQLNGVRLDVRHTVLTPDYLEGLLKH